MTFTDDQIIDLARRDAAPWAERAQALAAAQIERQLPLLGELAEAGLEVARAIERAARAWTPPSAPGADKTADEGAGRAADALAAKALATKALAVEARAAEAEAQIVEGRIAEAEGDETGPAIDEIEPRPESGPGIEGLSLAYARASRAVRLTVALQSKLVKDLETLHQSTDKRDRWKARQAQGERKEAVAQAVKSLAYAEKPDQERADAFHEAARGWMETDRYGDLLDRPMSEVVARVCKDVGLTPDWARLAEDAWARAEIAGGKPGEPLRAFLAARESRDDAEAEDEDDSGRAPGHVAGWRARRRPQAHAGSP